MKKISVDDITDPVTLAQDVIGSAGNVLLGKGTSLTAAMARRLKNWGVPVVAIEGEEVAGSESGSAGGSAEPEENRTAYLAECFSGHLDKPAMKTIHDAVMAFWQSEEGRAS